MPRYVQIDIDIERASGRTKVFQEVLADLKTAFPENKETFFCDLRESAAMALIFVVINKTSRLKLNYRFCSHWLCHCHPPVSTGMRDVGEEISDYTNVNPAKEPLSFSFNFQQWSVQCPHYLHRRYFQSRPSMYSIEQKSLYLYRRPKAPGRLAISI